MYVVQVRERQRPHGSVNRCPGEIPQRLTNVRNWIVHSIRTESGWRASFVAGFFLHRQQPQVSLGNELTLAALLNSPSTPPTSPPPHHPPPKKNKKRQKERKKKTRKEVWFASECFDCYTVSRMAEQRTTVLFLERKYTWHAHPVCCWLTPSPPQPVKFPGWKMQRRALQTVSFQSYNTSTFNAMRFDETPLTCQCENGDKKVSKLQILHFYWSFSSDVMAVKGLRQLRHSTMQVVMFCLRQLM